MLPVVSGDPRGCIARPRSARYRGIGRDENAARRRAGGAQQGVHRSGPSSPQLTGCSGLSACPGVARVFRLRTSTRVSSFARLRPRTMPDQCSAGRS